MPKCIVCNTRFYPQTLSEPAEPCDCQMEARVSDFEDAEEFQAACKWWDKRRNEPAGEDVCGE